MAGSAWAFIFIQESVMETKQCPKCGAVKSVSEFHKHKGRKDGLYCWCKDCVKVCNKAYRIAHKEEAARYRANHQEERKANCRRWHTEHREEEKEYKRQYNAEHREEQKEYCRQYNASHREERRETKRRWDDKHQEEIMQYRSAHRKDKARYLRGYYIKNKDMMLERMRRWRVKNPEKSRAIVERRRACKVNAEGECSGQQYIWRGEVYGNRCYICGAPAEAMDHVIPLAKGGSNWPANLRPICRRCNSVKGQKWPYDFEQARLEVLV